MAYRIVQARDEAREPARYRKTRQPVPIILATFLVCGVLLGAVALTIPGSKLLIPYAIGIFFLPASGIFCARVTTTLYSDRIEQRRGPIRRVLRFDDTQHVILRSVAIDPFIALTQITTDALMIWGVNDVRITLTDRDMPPELRNEIGKRALLIALSRAEKTLRDGGTYIGPQRLHSLSANTIEGFTVGLTRKRVSASIDNITDVSPMGLVTTSDGKRFWIGPFDLVMRELLSRVVRHGKERET